VRDEVDNLRDDVEEAIRNLHMDMIRQFHLQSQEINNVLSTHLATIERLTEENRSLRETIEMLRGGRS
jgi:protein NEDD1